MSRSPSKRMSHRLSPLYSCFLTSGRDPGRARRVRRGERNPGDSFPHGYTGEGQAIRHKVNPRSSSVPDPFQNDHFRHPPKLSFSKTRVALGSRLAQIVQERKPEVRRSPAWIIGGSGFLSYSTGQLSWPNSSYWPIFPSKILPSSPFVRTHTDATQVSCANAVGAIDVLWA